MSRSQCGDVGDELSSFRFRDEAGLLGKKHDALVNGRRNRPRKDHARHRLHCPDGRAHRSAPQASAFEDEGVRENVLFDGARAASKEICGSSIGLRDSLARDDDEHHSPGRAFGHLLKEVERSLGVQGRRRAPPPTEEHGFLGRTDDVGKVVDNLHEPHSTNVFGRRKAFCHFGIKKKRPEQPKIRASTHGTPQNHGLFECRLALEKGGNNDVASHDRGARKNSVSNENRSLEFTKAETLCARRALAPVYNGAWPCDRSIRTYVVYVRWNHWL